MRISHLGLILQNKSTKSIKVQNFTPLFHKNLYKMKISNLTVFMFCFLISYFSPLSTSAQEVALITRTVLRKPMATNKNKQKEASQEASQQLRKYLKNNVQLPKTRGNRAVEGNIVVEVQLSKYGKLVGTQIKKSLQKDFDAAVLKALNNLDQICLEGERYIGAKSIQIPINIKNN